MPTDWRVWTIGMPLTALILIGGLIAIARIWKSVRVQVGKNSVSVGQYQETQIETTDHECKQLGLLTRLVESVDLMLAGIGALLSHNLKQGANGYTAKALESVEANSRAWKEFYIEKGVGD